MQHRNLEIFQSHQGLDPKSIFAAAQYFFVGPGPLHPGIGHRIMILHPCCEFHRHWGGFVAHSRVQAVRFHSFRTCTKSASYHVQLDPIPA
jgi:hypothetical protein